MAILDHALRFTVNAIKRGCNGGSCAYTHEEPGSGMTLGPRLATHARVSAATLTFFLSASSFSASTNARLCLKYSSLKRAKVRRWSPSGIHMSNCLQIECHRRTWQISGTLELTGQKASSQRAKKVICAWSHLVELQVTHEYANTATPSSCAVASTLFVSSSIDQGLTSISTPTIGCTAYALRSVSALHSDRPMWPKRPWSTNPLSRRMVSSIGYL